MILIKKYHYNFPAEYFDDYRGNFNKDEFLKIEQLKEKLRRRETDSLSSSNAEWKKYTDLGGMDKKDDENDNAGNNSSICGGSVQGVWAKGELKEHTGSFGKEVPDEDVPNDTHGSLKLELNDAVSWMIEMTKGIQEFLELEKNYLTKIDDIEEELMHQRAINKRLQEES